jgi:hypothetical protein
MIRVILSGGLGNQMFQYAAGRSLAILHSTKLVLDLSNLKLTSSKVTKRGFELENFKIVAEVDQGKNSFIVNLLDKTPLFLNRLVNKNIIYKEKDQNFDKDMLLQSDNTCISGYWQSHKYFNSIKSQLIDEFQPIAPLSYESQKVMHAIESSNSVAVHIRRSDYISNRKASSFHGVLALSYYFNAMNLIKHKYNDANYFIFSDDYEWCNNNFKNNYKNINIIDANKHGEKRDWEDLILMSKCNHHVIANSTFSWWPAWLADFHEGNHNHVVIAPKNWFNDSDAKFNTLDRFPAHWILL